VRAQPIRTFLYLYGSSSRFTSTSTGGDALMPGGVLGARAIALIGRWARALLVWGAVMR
jgi:hypothetical protein